MANTRERRPQTNAATAPLPTPQQKKLEEYDRLMRVSFFAALFSIVFPIISVLWVNWAIPDRMPDEQARMFFAAKGEVIKNTVSKERIKFLETARDTGGEFTTYELYIPKNGFISSSYHYHPKQQEHVEIIQGEVEIFLDDDMESILLSPEDETKRQYTIEPNVPHYYYIPSNATDVVLRITMSPSLQFEYYQSMLFALAGFGNTDKQAKPFVTYSALFQEYMMEDILPAKTQTWVMRGIFFFLKAWAKIRGYTLPFQVR